MWCDTLRATILYAVTHPRNLTSHGTLSVSVCTGVWFMGLVCNMSVQKATVWVEPEADVQVTCWVVETI